jgi:hypothetical protein
MRLLSRRPNADIYTEVSDGELRWATVEYVTDDLLQRLASSRNLNRRAPTGDKHGSWQKVAEVPLSIVLQHIPMPDWEDRKAWKKMLDNPDFSKFRADGPHRRY